LSSSKLHPAQTIVPTGFEPNEPFYTFLFPLLMPIQIFGVFILLISFKVLQQFCEAVLLKHKTRDDGLACIIFQTTVAAKMEGVSPIVVELGLANESVSRAPADGGPSAGYSRALAVNQFGLDDQSGRDACNKLAFSTEASRFSSAATCCLSSVTAATCCRSSPSIFF
jgi:hypothetical protein